MAASFGVSVWEETCCVTIPFAKIAFGMTTLLTRDVDARWRHGSYVPWRHRYCATERGRWSSLLTGVHVAYKLNERTESDFSDLCVWLVFMRLSPTPPVKVL